MIEKIHKTIAGGAAASAGSARIKARVYLAIYDVNKTILAEAKSASEQADKLRTEIHEYLMKYFLSVKPLMGVRLSESGYAVRTDIGQERLFATLTSLVQHAKMEKFVRLSVMPLDKPCLTMLPDPSREWLDANLQ